MRICIKLFKFRIKEREEVEFFFPKRNLGIEMFSETVSRVLSYSQKPFTTQFGKGCCVSTLTKTPRYIYMWPYCYGLVVLNKIKSLGLLGHVSFRIHCCTSTSCLSNGWSCRDLACLSCMPKWHCWQKSTHLKVNFLLICFQQLFTPDIATQRLPLAE